MINDYSSPAGYEESMAMAESADIAFGEGWQDMAADRESLPYVSESDLPIGAYDADMEDIGIALDRYILGFSL